VRSHGISNRMDEDKEGTTHKSQIRRDQLH
jgi:hypothetical protein